MDINKLLKVSTLAGKILLESGAETYRVEETIVIICNSFGAENTQSFVTPTGIMISIIYNNQVSTIVQRITSRGVDLNKIDKINSLSRKIQRESIKIDTFYDELIKISKGERYSPLVTLLSSSLAAGCFAMMFGGNIKDFIGASLIGAVIKIIAVICQKLNINDFFINSLCGGITACLAILLMKLHICSNIDKTIIGSIMLLVPGLTITNAIRDTIAGDVLSGVTKTSEAIFVAVSIAVGTGAVLSLFLNSLGGM